MALQNQNTQQMEMPFDERLIQNAKIPLPMQNFMSKKMFSEPFELQLDPRITSDKVAQKLTALSIYATETAMALGKDVADKAVTSIIEPAKQQLAMFSEQLPNMTAAQANAELKPILESTLVEKSLAVYQSVKEAEKDIRENGFTIHPVHQLVNSTSPASRKDFHKASEALPAKLNPQLLPASIKEKLPTSFLTEFKTITVVALQQVTKIFFSLVQEPSLKATIPIYDPEINHSNLAKSHADHMRGVRDKAAMGLSPLHTYEKMDNPPAFDELPEDVQHKMTLEQTQQYSTGNTETQKEIIRTLIQSGHGGPNMMSPILMGLAKGFEPGITVAGAPPTGGKKDHKETREEKKEVAAKIADHPVEKSPPTTPPKPGKLETTEETKENRTYEEEPDQTTNRKKKRSKWKVAAIVVGGFGVGGSVALSGMFGAGFFDSPPPKPTTANTTIVMFLK